MLRACDKASWSLNFKKWTLFVPLLTSVSFLAQVFNEIMICQFLSNGAFFLWKCYVRDIFTINSKWKVVISGKKKVIIVVASN